MCCNRQPTSFCVLDKGRQPSPHVSRQFIWASTCHTWGYTQNSGCATWGRWILSMLCSECSWLHHCESIPTGSTHLAHSIFLTSFATSGYFHSFLSSYNLSVCFSLQINKLSGCKGNTDACQRFSNFVIQWSIKWDINLCGPCNQSYWCIRINEREMEHIIFISVCRPQLSSSEAPMLNFMTC
jgi:hypothetical protein